MKQMLIKIATGLIFFGLLSIHKDRNGFESTVILGISVTIASILSIQGSNDRKN